MRGPGRLPVAVAARLGCGTRLLDERRRDQVVLQQRVGESACTSPGIWLTSVPLRWPLGILSFVVASLDLQPRLSQLLLGSGHLLLGLGMAVACPLQFPVPPVTR